MEDISIIWIEVSQGASSTPVEEQARKISRYWSACVRNMYGMDALETKECKGFWQHA
jgi:hypothetical protein